MHDLSNHLVYKTSFDVNAVDEDREALWLLMLDIRRWICNKWGRRGVEINRDNAQWGKFKLGSASGLNEGQDSVYFESAALKNGGVIRQWACSIEETIRSDKGQAPRIWKTEVGFARRSTCSGTFSLVLVYGDRPGFLGPLQEEPSPTIPNLVRIILADPRLQCTSDGRSVSMDPIELVVGDFPKFWHFVSLTSRTTPVVYISPMHPQQGDEEQDADKLLVDPAAVANTLGPSAFVFYSRSAGFTEEMRFLLKDKNLRCENGSLRVYAAHPDFNDENDWPRHRFFSARQINELGPEAILDILHRALAQDVDFYESMTRVQTVRDAIREQRVYLQIDLMKQQRDKSKQELDESQLQYMIKEQEFDNWLADYEETCKNRDDLSRENREFAKKNRELLIKADSLQRALREQVSTSASLPSDLQCPPSRRNVAELFATTFASRIDFTERAWGSLDDRACNTSPEVLAQALYYLSVLAYDLFTREQSTDIKREFDRRAQGFTYGRGNGKQTNRDPRLSSLYKDTYLGRTIDCGPHIKRGNDESKPGTVRIYFGFDRVANKIIVCYCHHLDNYETQFRH